MSIVFGGPGGFPFGPSRIRRMLAALQDFSVVLSDPGIAATGVRAKRNYSVAKARTERVRCQMAAAPELNCGESCKIMSGANERLA